MKKIILVQIGFGILSLILVSFLVMGKLVDINYYYDDRISKYKSGVSEFLYNVVSQFGWLAMFIVLGNIGLSIIILRKM